MLVANPACEIESDPVTDLDSGFDLGEQVLDLTQECPFDHGNPEGCQLHGIRKWSLKERLDWVWSLSRQAKLRILAFHEKCLEEKRGKPPVSQSSKG